MEKHLHGPDGSLLPVLPGHNWCRLNAQQLRTQSKTAGWKSNSCLPLYMASYLVPVEGCSTCPSQSTSLQWHLCHNVALIWPRQVIEWVHSKNKRYNMEKMVTVSIWPTESLRYQELSRIPRKLHIAILLIRNRALTTYILILLFHRMAILIETWNFSPVASKQLY